jgi:hypothetical protein
MAIDITQLSPVSITLASGPIPFSIAIPNITAPTNVSVVLTQPIPVTTTATKPFIAPSGLTIM